MQVTSNTLWQALPPITVPSPVIALAADTAELWVGGIGGIARRSRTNEWQTRISGLPLTGVAALAFVHNILLAGGTGGIAYSKDNGLTWQQATLQEGIASVTSLITSPRFAHDHTALAATLESGILRTVDAGQTWHSASFGLQNFEVTSLAWGEGELVLAATQDGLYRSPNAGRAWRFVGDSAGMAIVTVLFLPNGTALAALEDGGLLCSSDAGLHWDHYSDTPANTKVSSLWRTPEGSLLLATVEQGLLRATQKDLQWQQVLSENVLSLVSQGNILYSGTMQGVNISTDDGQTWTSLPHPPVHDLRQLLIFQGHPRAIGPYTGLAHYRSDTHWEITPNTLEPFTALVVAPDESLFASNAEGLWHSQDEGRTWQNLVSGETGHVAHLTFRSDGSGWAGNVDSSHLLRTRDMGRTWQRLSTPFGILPLAALQAGSKLLIAVTYDPRQYLAQFWRSLDDGETWERGATVETSWPQIATHDHPLLVTLGSMLLLQKPSGEWSQKTVGEDENKGSPVRRVVSHKQSLYALTLAGILHSTDEGRTWKHFDDGLDITQVLDIAVTTDTLFVLLAGGHVYTRHL